MLHSIFSVHTTNLLLGIYTLHYQKTYNTLATTKVRAQYKSTHSLQDYSNANAQEIDSHKENSEGGTQRKSRKEQIALLHSQKRFTKRKKIIHTWLPNIISQTHKLTKMEEKMTASLSYHHQALTTQRAK